MWRPKLLVAATLLVACPGCLMTAGLWLQEAGPGAGGGGALEVRARRVVGPGALRYLVELRGPDGWTTAEAWMDDERGLRRGPAPDEAADAQPVLVEPLARDGARVTAIRVVDRRFGVRFETSVGGDARGPTRSDLTLRAAQVVLTPAMVGLDLATWPLQLVVIGPELFLLLPLLLRGDGELP